MSLPVFTPTAIPVVDEGMLGTHVDYKGSTCAACGDVCWAPDTATRTCRPCWRSGVYAVAAWREAVALGPSAFDDARKLP